MSTSRRSTSSVEQGELEASPDLRHSPQIVLEPDESSEQYDFVRSSRAEKTSRMKPVEISSPERLLKLCAVEFINFIVTKTLTKLWLHSLLPKLRHTMALKSLRSRGSIVVFHCLLLHMCLKMKNEKWFIAYSSSMLDCTWNIKTLKQEHTIQNHNTPVTYNIQ